MTTEELLKYYRDSASHFKNIRDKEEKKLLILSLLRLACFAGGMILIIYLFLEQNQAVALSVTFVVLFLFIYLVKLYSDHSGQRDYALNRYTININEASALEGDLSAFDNGEGYVDHSHDYSFDIDIFGSGSLFCFLNRTVTGSGSEILAKWISDPYEISKDLLSRQEIIRELAEKVEWRHRFMAEGMRVPLDKESVNRLLGWINETPAYRITVTRKILMYLLPLLALSALVLVLAGFLHYSLLILVLTINLGYVSMGLKKNNSVHNAVTGSYSYLSSMNRLLEVISSNDFNSQHLIVIKNDIAGAGISASMAAKKLGKLIQAFDSRLNILAGFTLNALLLWDYQCVARIDKWRKTYKDFFPSWLNTIASLDGYSSLANYAFNNNGFVYPEISTTGKIITANGLGHPLINKEKRVCNDFSIESMGKICIITGANMAGKSTFLRTVAVNFILAMTGSPVCASGMEFTPVRLFTSMRTTDSLSVNESYFYAELKRLRILKSRIDAGDPVFFILDEILKGTNSADKTQGSWLFIKKLISKEATGMIATHDTSLGELEKVFPGNVFNKCFEIDINGDAISFDYKLLDGVTQKMNAALLMRQMGIVD